MAMKQQGRLAQPSHDEIGNGRMKAPCVPASKRLSPALNDVAADTLSAQALRGIYAQRSANLFTRVPWEISRSTGGLEPMTSSSADPHRSSYHRNSSRRILVAEDDAVVRQLMQNWLQAWGYQVVLTRSGAEAWKVLQQERAPELVIMDWMMPEIDGVELSRRLRHEQRDYYRYVLLITGKSEKQDVGYALESGADDYLVKPFNSDELSARLTVANRILSLQDHLIRAGESLFDQATKDALTGLWNRAALLDLFQRELDRASRSKASTGLLILDLDNFKTVNDAYGHLTGDLVLKEIAGRLKQAVRSYDLVGRYGGEEFLIVFPGCNRDELLRIAEKIRLSVARKPVLAGTHGIPITLSIGATTITSGDSSAENMIAAADVALYRAKNTGRNRSVLYDRSCQEIPPAKDTRHALRDR